MERPKNLVVLEGISCLAYNPSLSMCVLSKKDKNLYIFKVKNLFDYSQWELIYTLKAHSENILSIDWNVKSNLIISSSLDRNVYIWEYSNKYDHWKPQLCIFKSKFSIFSVKWNSFGDKFCGGTGGRQVLVGYYCKNKKLWKGEEIKYHKSAVLSVDFDPTGLFVISGSIDMSIAIHSSYIKDIDDSKKEIVNTEFDEIFFKVSE